METDEELFAKARAHMEKYSAAASLDRRLWDATVRLALKGMRPEEQRSEIIDECADTCLAYAQLEQQAADNANAAGNDDGWAVHGAAAEAAHNLAANIRALKGREPQREGS